MLENIAFLIGNSRYDNLSHLPGCINDVTLIKELLEATGKFSQIIEFKDETVSDVSSALKEVSGSIEEIGEFFVYFTGHGVSTTEDFFMCFREFRESSPNTTGLSRTELLDIFRGSCPDVAVFVVDACEAGKSLIKADTQPIHIMPKTGLGSFIQFSSCSETQGSFATTHLSFFTKSFAEASLIKTSGAVYYSDIENALRDSFLGSSGQTPYFIRQSSSREKFCNDATFLNPIRDKFKEQTPPTLPSADVEDEIDPLVAALDTIKKIELEIPSEQEAQEFVNCVISSVLTDESLAGTLIDFFEMRPVYYDDYNGVQNKKSIVALLERRGGSDKFVEGEEERIKKKDPLSRFALSIGAAMTLGQEEYDTQYDLWNHCGLKSVHVGLYFEPKHMALSRVFSEIVFLPRLRECLILTSNNIQQRSGWGSFQEWQGLKKWTWSSASWRDDPEEVARKYADRPFTHARDYVVSVAEADRD